jgi:DNA-binding Lrp family transcriptional regulator
MTQWYYDLANDLADRAPAQAKLLRSLLLQQEMREIEEIREEMGISMARLRQLIGRLRDEGVEVISKRVHAPGNVNEDVRYVYGVATDEVEGWSGERRKAVLTAWDRTLKVFERHLSALQLDPVEMGEILGVMKYVRKTLKDIDLDVSIRTEEKAAEQAAIRQEAEVPA